MSTTDNKENTYEDPTNRVVCIFDEHDQALEAKKRLVDFGFEPHQIHLLRGDKDAAEVDTSAKWFADTDEEMKKFEREIRKGATVLSAPVKDCGCREEVHDIVKSLNARNITHFGDWVTEVMR